MNTLIIFTVIMLIISLASWYFVYSGCSSKVVQGDANPLTNETQQLTKPDGKIFISYRRVDSADITGRLFDRLKKHYGACVFKDVDSIPVGVDFRDHISQALDEAEIFICVIGPSWLRSQDDVAGPRVKKDDHVMLEIESALDKKIPIIPILVRNAVMPEKHELTEETMEITYRNATMLRPDPDFNTDCSRIFAAIEEILTSSGVSG